MKRTYSELMAIDDLKKIRDKQEHLINGNFSFVAAKYKIKVRRLRELWEQENASVSQT